MVAAVRVENMDAVHKLLRDIGDIPVELQKNGRQRQLLEKIRDDVLIPEYMDQFLEGGKPPWEPIAPSTAFNRKKGRPEVMRFGDFSTVSTGNLTPLTDRGLFRRSATAKARFHIKSNVMSYGGFPQSMWWALPIHEYGEADLIPQRSWIGQTIQRPQVRDEIIDITWDWVRDRVDSAMTRRRYV